MGRQDLSVPGGAGAPALLRLAGGRNPEGPHSQGLPKGEADLPCPSPELKPVELGGPERTARRYACGYSVWRDLWGRRPAPPAHSS